MWAMSLVLQAAADAASSGSDVKIIGAIGVGTIVSAAITAGSLIYQNRKNGQRDDRRRTEDTAERKKERDHATNEAEKERNHAVVLLQAEKAAERQNRRETDERATSAALNSEWRGERREAHSKFLAAVEDHQQRVNENFSNYFRPNAAGFAVTTGDFERLAQSDRDDVGQLLADVELLGSDPSREAARSLWANVRHADITLWWASLGHDYETQNPDGALNYERMKKTLARMETSRTTYVNAVRMEIGTI